MLPKLTCPQEASCLATTLVNNFGFLLYTCVYFPLTSISFMALQERNIFCSW